jgi:hypothetical protein
MTEKQLVPKHVADWIDYCKANKFFLLGALCSVGKFGEGLADDYKGSVLEAMAWIKSNQDEFARAWLNGYEVEQPVKYTVCIKGVASIYKFLKYNKADSYWYFSNGTSGEYFTPYHTKEELEKAGFGWVFSCEGVSIVEVK